MATIIRSDRPGQQPAGEAIRPANFTFSDMSVQGDEYLQAVRVEAAKVVQQANAKAEEIRKQAQHAGETAARNSIEKLLADRLGQHLNTLRPALDGLVKQLDTAHDAWLDHWEKSAVKLAVAIAERIIRRELESEPDISLTWVRESLDLAAGSTEITVRLNPSDHKRLESQIDKLAASTSRLGETNVVADEAISLGGCRVDTKHGSIDQQLETQLARLTEELT